MEMLNKKDLTNFRCALKGVRKGTVITATVFLLMSGSVMAGHQREEFLKDETKNLLSRTISESAPKFSTFSSQLEEHMWLVRLNNELRFAIPHDGDRVDFLKSVHYEATRAGLEPLMVLGLIKVESAFKKYAISEAGARGYMQVMPFWIEAIGDKKHSLFHMRTNLRYGCTILKHYLELEKGNVYMALGRYNGSRGQDKYPRLVQNATMELKRKIKYET